MRTILSTLANLESGNIGARCVYEILSTVRQAKERQIDRQATEHCCFYHYPAAEKTAHVTHKYTHSRGSTLKFVVSL